MDYINSSSQLEEKLQRLKFSNAQNNDSVRKTGPSVPPKPCKNQPIPEIPQSSYVGQACKPLYSQRLQFTDTTANNNEKPTSTPIEDCNAIDARPTLLQRKKNIFCSQNAFENNASKVTLDNPAILEQQLEVLTHHKKQLERKGLLPKQPLHNVPKLSSTSLASSGSDEIYANVLSAEATKADTSKEIYKEIDKTYSNVNNQRRFFEKAHTSQLELGNNCNKKSKIYSNVTYEKTEPDDFTCSENQGDESQPPSSPVSSSYSELLRANGVFSVKKLDNCLHEAELLNASNLYARDQNYMNIKYKNEFGNQDSMDYYGVGGFSQTSSAYESIYEPINPQPSSQQSSRSNLLNYSPYLNTEHSQMPNLSGNSILSNSSSLNLLSLGGVETSPDNMSLYSSGGGDEREHPVSSLKSETEVENLTNFLVHSIDGGNDMDNYGVCFQCNERVLGENSGCTAMNQIYHIACFTCSQCQINLQGKPFYALDGKPFCEYDYLQTLEKCSVCMKPILERILRATGKPYHPQCFTCIACGKSLDGIPFTVDATNQNYCIEDFHKKFAPRCCVCKEPIMPEPGEEETVRVVALDRSFHFECYKCEDCGLLLSSEAEGRGCYPLDDHVLCKSCNAKRVQLLTNFITTEI